MITYREGDLFASGLPAIAHGVNCSGVMGAGIAAQFKARWPQMYESYRRRCLKGHMIPGDVLSWQYEGGIVFNLATQDKPGADAKPWMITAAVGQMIQEAHYIYKSRSRFDLTEIGLPLIGCGIGGLDPGGNDLRRALLPYADAPVNLIVYQLVPAAPPPSCDGLDGESCGARALWLLAYQCPAGHDTQARLCDRHDRQVSVAHVVSRLCRAGTADGMCPAVAELISRRMPGRSAGGG